MNEVWLEIVMLAHDLIVWTQALCLDGELAKAEPKRVALPAAARRRPARVLRTPREAAPPQGTWPWTEALKAAFEKLKTLASRHRLTPAAGHHTTKQTPRPRPRSPLPANRPTPADSPLEARRHPQHPA